MIVSWDAIFPIPVMRTNLGRDFTEEEKRFFVKMRENSFPNVSNTSSRNNYILDEPEMKALRSFFEDAVRQYARKIISVNDKLEFYITQSWLNYTDTGQSHHRHMHTNSLISGSFYINAMKEVDRLYFYRADTQQINVWNKEQNWYNADSWFFSVGVGDLILFPSHVQHGVEKTVGEHTRTSLAFNTFVRGEIGAPERLNALKL